jgi:hypothetical protein
LLDLGGVFWWPDYETFGCGNTLMVFGLFEQFACFNLINLIISIYLKKIYFSKLIWAPLWAEAPSISAAWAGPPKRARPMLLSDIIRGRS